MRVVHRNRDEESPVVEHDELRAGDLVVTNGNPKRTVDDPGEFDDDYLLVTEELGLVSVDSGEVYDLSYGDEAIKKWLYRIVPDAELVVYTS